MPRSPVKGFDDVTAPRRHRCAKVGLRGYKKESGHIIVGVACSISKKARFGLRLGICGTEGIFEVDMMSTTSIHFMLDRREVVLSNGAWTVSFQRDYSLKGIGQAQRT